jgi:hypothetical protein
MAGSPLTGLRALGGVEKVPGVLQGGVIECANDPTDSE